MPFSLDELFTHKSILESREPKLVSKVGVEPYYSINFITTTVFIDFKVEMQSLRESTAGKAENNLTTLFGLLEEGCIKVHIIMNLYSMVHGYMANPVLLMYADYDVRVNCSLVVPSTFSSPIVF